MGPDELARPMNPGDLVHFGSEVPEEHDGELVLVLEVGDDSYVRVIMGGRPLWVPKSFVAPMQPAADHGITLSSTGGTNE